MRNPIARTVAILTLSLALALAPMASSITAQAQTQSAAQIARKNDDSDPKRIYAVGLGAIFGVIAFNFAAYNSAPARAFLNRTFRSIATIIPSTSAAPVRVAATTATRAATAATTATAAATSVASTGPSWLLETHSRALMVVAASVGALAAHVGYFTYNAFAGIGNPKK
ncbi:membrane hypothetical protein [Azospirillaceae bacterium]